VRVGELQIPGGSLSPLTVFRVAQSGCGYSHPSGRRYLFVIFGFAPEWVPKTTNWELGTKARSKPAHDRHSERDEERNAEHQFRREPLTGVFRVRGTRTICRALIGRLRGSTGRRFLG